MTESSLSSSQPAGRVRSRGLLTGLFLSVSALGFWVGQNLPTSEHPPLTEAAPPPLQVDPKALDFGEAWAQPDFQWTLPITNTSSADVHVLKIEQSCRCTSVEPESFVLQPGQTQNLRVTLDLTETAPPADGATARPFSVYLTAALADRPSGEQRWYLQGKVRSWITATPGTVYLGEVSVASPETFPPHLVALTLHERVSRLTAECRSTLAEVRVAHDVNSAHASLEVIPKRLPLGRVDFRIRLSAKTGSGQRLPDAYVPVTGSVMPDVYCVPERLFLGTLPLGSATTTTLSLRSRLSLPFSVTGIESDDPGLVAKPIASTDDAFCFRISQRAAALGLQSATLYVRARSGPDNIIRDLAVPVHYVGVEPPRRRMNE